MLPLTKRTVILDVLRRGRRAIAKSDSDSTTSSASTNPSHLSTVPDGLLTLYDSAKGGTSTCKNGVVLDTFSSGFFDNGDDAPDLKTHYCGDSKTKPTYIYWMSNMDVDCDGSDGSGDCDVDGSYQDETTFQVAGNSKEQIDALSVPYVVISNGTKVGFIPEDFGVQPLSAVAVVCGAGGKLTFGVWADTNELGSMGEGSITLAKTCFGDSMTGANGHDAPDVLYVAFTADARLSVPSGSGSNWDSLQSIGSALVANAFNGTTSTNTTSSASTGVSSTSKTSELSSTLDSELATSTTSSVETSLITASKSVSSPTEDLPSTSSQAVKTEPATVPPRPSTVAPATSTSLPEMTPVSETPVPPTTPATTVASPTLAPTSTTSSIGGFSTTQLAMGIGGLAFLIIIIIIGILLVHHQSSAAAPPPSYAKAKDSDSGSGSDSEKELGKKRSRSRRSRTARRQILESDSEEDAEEKALMSV